MLVLAAVAALSGCETVAPVTVFRDTGLTRAAFDLDCPREQLQVTLLAPSRAFDGIVTCTGAQVGVTGCGHHAVYVCEHGHQWRGETLRSSP
jgi:hypothetical protein